MATAPIIVIDMQEGLYWGDCPLCGQEKRLDHAVGWYEEAVHEDIGTILPHGGEVGGKCVCRECHDRHYAPGAATMTAPTPTAATPEELARTTDMRASLDRAYAIASPTGAANHLAAWANNHGKALLDLIEAQRAEIERLRVMADEPTTKRVWDGIQAMAGLFADPDHMPTVLEFKAAFDAAFVMDGKPYDVERIKEEWQADYAAMEARATAAEAALAAVTAERDRMREALEKCAAAFEQPLTGIEEAALNAARAALQPQETADVR